MERRLTLFLRIIRFSKMAALVADIWTLLYAVFIVGWQITFFVRNGDWPALPLASVINKLESSRVATYATASVGEIQKGQLPNVTDTLLRIPAIVLLLLAAALLTAFYRWLTHIENRYLEN